MSRLVVIADQDTALGFQLAGVEVFRADDPEDAQTELRRLMNDEDVGLIAVSASLLDELDDAMRRRIEASIKPVVVALPMGARVSGVVSPRERFAALIRRAVGLHITFPGEDEGV